MKKLIEYSLYFLLFLLPWQTRWIWKSGEWEYVSGSLYGTEILLGLIFLLSIFYLITNYKLLITNFQLIFNLLINWKRILKIFFVFLFLCFLVLLSIIFALDSSLAFYYLSKIITGIILIILIRYFADFTKSAYAFIAGMALQAGLGIWQFLSQSSFASKWLGMAMQNSSILGTSVVETDSGRWIRAYGALPHPNIFAGYLVVAILLIVILYIRRERRLVPAKSGILFPALIILSTALSFTFSRAAWIALIISISFYLFTNLNNKIKLKKILKLSSICLLVFIIFSFIYSPLLKTRAYGENRLEIKSTTERIESFSESFQIIKNYPFLGTGPGNYTLAVRNLIDPNRESYKYQPSHNIYLLMIAEIGIVGAICFYIFIFLYFYYPRKENFKFIILLPIIIIGIFDHYPITLYSGIMLISLCLGLSLLKFKNTG